MSIHTANKFRHYNKDGLLLWGSTVGEVTHEGIYKGSALDLEVVRNQDWLLNALADEGEKDILDVYFDDVAVRTNLYGRLYNDTPIETDTLALLTGEVTGTGYAAVDFARGTDWGDPTLDSGDMMTTSTTKTYTGGAGGWSAATYIVLATVSSGTAGLLIAYNALSATRTLAEGDTLDVSFTVKLA